MRRTDSTCVVANELRLHVHALNVYASIKLSDDVLYVIATVEYLQLAGMVYNESTMRESTCTVIGLVRSDRRCLYEV